MSWWGIIAPLIAIATTLAWMQAAVALTDAIRNHDYHLFENKSSDALAKQFSIPTIDPSAAEARRQSLSPFLDKAHRAASVAQTTYHKAVVRSAGCLVLAFLAMGFGTLPPEYWPMSERLNWPYVELLLSWLDALALLFVLILFLHGSITRRPWIKGRVGTELLRQYQILSVVFPSAVSTAPADDLQTQFDREANRVATGVQDGSITDIGARIERFWSTRKASIEGATLTEADLSAEALLVYLQRRARRQLGWFIDSKARLERIGERRNIMLLSLYSIAVGFAVIKLLLFLYGGHSPAYLLRLLLIVTGMSAAMTAYYINQNSRSLIHRYNNQQRNATGWLVAFNDRWNFAALPAAIISPSTKKDIRAQILRFEDLMIEELIDWIHITSHDAIELAP
ncbi:MAG: hypothetical protein JOY83_17045 [Alphaproteobacteria bacterium]|nr:hypothetical protein [Alphaproteobacteria bacterium]